jgi:hypothetical protein
MHRSVTSIPSTAVPLLITCVLLLASAAQALPIVGATANTIPAGTFMIDMWATWQDYSMAYGSGGDTPGWESLEPGATATSGSLVPRVYYGVTDLLTIRAALPFEDRYVEDSGWETGKSNTGLGDVIIDPKFRLTRGDNGFPLVALLGGIRLPTGNTEGVDNSNVAPLSDGSTDFTLGASITQSAPPMTAHLTACYWINGERSNGTRGDNLWVGLATLESDIDENWTLLWEFKGVFSQSDNEYRRTYVCPGIEWRGETVTVGFCAMVSATAIGGAGPGRYDFDWAPYLRVYYKLF